MEDGSSEGFFYVNGICTTRRMALATGGELSQMFSRHVTVVHNPTDSIVVDILECIFAKLWAGQSFATSRPCALLVDKLVEALQDPKKEKVGSSTSFFCVVYGPRSLRGNCIRRLRSIAVALPDFLHPGSLFFILRRSVVVHAWECCYLLYAAEHAGTTLFSNRWFS